MFSVRARPAPFYRFFVNSAASLHEMFTSMAIIAEAIPTFHDTMGQLEVTIDLLQHLRQLEIADIVRNSTDGMESLTALMYSIKLKLVGFRVRVQYHQSLPLLSSQYGNLHGGPLMSIAKELRNLRNFVMDQSDTVELMIRGWQASVKIPGYRPPY